MLVRHEEAVRLNWALLDVAGTVCTAIPACPACPLRLRCRTATASRRRSRAPS